MVKVEIVADSLASSGVRLTTFVLTYPRMIHAEFMTHRVFSRNASSSRAIPVKRQIQEVIDNPAIPEKFLKNKAGMQGGEELQDQDAAINAWLEGRDRAVEVANKLADLEVHKQYANRVLEPWAHITVVCTATDWDNWFSLRYHPMAQPEITEVARQMWKAYRESTPTNIADGEWHLPFISDVDRVNFICNDLAIKDMENFSTKYLDQSNTLMIKSSVARCARVSYKNHDGTSTTVEQDLQLYDRLLGNKPIHASPAEHQAMAVGDPSVRSGNFRGWIQFRKTLREENITQFVPLEDFE